jgi:exosome complex exonuclease RRP6
MEDSTTPMASASFDPYLTRLQTAALGATKKSASLPPDILFHRSMDSEFAQTLDAFSDRVLAITNRLLNLVSTVDQTQVGRGKGKAKLESQDDLVDNFHSLVVDSMDQLLEKTVCFF